MAHVTEPEALKLALGMSATVALAARLRNLESQAATILDMAMAPHPETGVVDAKLGLMAVREVRATIELMGRVAGTLIDRVEVDRSRPDIDKGIEDALRAKGLVSTPKDDLPHEDEEPETVPVQLALLPGLLHENKTA